MHNLNITEELPCISGFNGKIALGVLGYRGGNNLWILFSIDSGSFTEIYGDISQNESFPDTLLEFEPDLFIKAPRRMWYFLEKD